MYITINNQNYNCSKRIVSYNNVKYFSVIPQPETISGEIKMYRDDGFELSTDNVSDYLRSEYLGTTLTLTNVPVPVPPEPQPDTRTNSEKRQAAYSEGYVNDTDWHITYNEKLYTCDELTLLGSRYEFREETDTANEIRAIVKAKVEEIREAYPPEDGEELEEEMEE